MTTTITRKRIIVSLVILLLAAVGLYGLLPQMGDFKSSLTALQDSSPALVLAAVGCSLLATVWAALIYMLLSLKRLAFGATLAVQLAGLFINRVLPAGIGGLGLNFLYLRAHRHTGMQATTIVALNNLLGAAGHAVLAVVIVVVSSLAFKDLHNVDVSSQAVAAGVALVVLAMLAGAMYLRRHAARARKWKHQLGVLVGYYGRHPVRLVVALCISMLLTLSNVMALWLCCQALGISLSMLQVFVVFTLGVAVGTATPTPGGIGGAEAALTAGLIAQGVDVPLALAAALLYRFASFWIGLLVGAGATAAVFSRRLLRASGA